jgi:hypothetical protein
MLIIVGWAGSHVASLPDKVTSWVIPAQTYIQSHGIGDIALIGPLLRSLLSAFSDSVNAFVAIIENNPHCAFAWIFGGWIVLYAVERVLKRVWMVSSLARIGGWMTILGALVALLATKWFAWLPAIYGSFPHDIPVAAGFIPLTLASFYFVPHYLYWSSWRYALVRDERTQDASLVIVGGVFNSDQRNVSLQRILDTHFHQDWWQRLLRVGNVELIEQGGKVDTLWHLERPEVFYSDIRECIKLRRQHETSYASHADEVGGV